MSSPVPNLSPDGAGPANIIIAPDHTTLAAAEANFKEMREVDRHNAAGSKTPSDSDDDNDDDEDWDVSGKGKGKRPASSLPVVVATMGDMANTKVRKVQNLDRPNGRDKPYARSKAHTKNTIVVFEVFGVGWAAMTSANYSIPGLRKAAGKCRGMCDWDFCKKPPTFHGDSDAAETANKVMYYSFESDAGPLFPVMFIDTDSYDVPTPVGNNAAEVLFDHLDARGYTIIVLDELEPASSIMSDIEIVKMCETGTTLAEVLADEDAYLCAESEDLETIYKRGKKLTGDWLREKKRKQGQAFARKPSTHGMHRSDSSASSSSSSTTSGGAGSSQQL